MAQSYDLIVEDDPTVVRDSHSKGLKIIDKTGLIKYKAIKKANMKAKQDEARLNNVENRLENLENKLDTILEILNGSIRK